MFPSIKWSRTHKLQCRKMYQLTVQYEEGGFHKWWVKIGGAATRHINTCRTYHLPPIIPPFVTYQHCHRWGWSSQRWWSRWNDDGNSTTILLRMFQMKCLCSNQIYLCSSAFSLYPNQSDHASLYLSCTLYKTRWHVPDAPLLVSMTNNKMDSGQLGWNCIVVRSLSSDRPIKGQTTDITIAQMSSNGRQCSFICPSSKIPFQIQCIIYWHDDTRHYLL